MTKIDKKVIGVSFKLEKLLEPITIRGMTLRNRVVMPAMHLGYCENGHVTEKLVDFYVERAKNQVGLIIVGGCYINKYAMGAPSMIGISDDRFIPGLKGLASSVKSYGAKIAAQLYHSGRYAFSMIIGDKAHAPSSIMSKLTREIPKRMTIEEIEQTIEDYGEAARRAKEAGFDAVEIISSAGYLIGQFLSPLTNRRTDKYGGNLRQRMTFALEVIERVREKVGANFPIIFRVSGDDFMEGSNDFHEAKVFAAKLEDAGVDIINVTGGWHETTIPQLTMNVPRGAYIYLAENIKDAVGIPVIACNRINDPLLAERILRRKKADLVGIARGLLADPEFVVKAAEGRFDEIRPCIACTQGCFDSVFMLQPVTCLVNPAAGREKKLELKPAVKPKKVLVAGGGPAGMQAAIILKKRGHDVTIYEKTDRLGGQLLLASAPKERREFKTFVDYLCRQIEKLGIKVVFRTEVTPELVNEVKPDVVVVATGARPIRPKIPGIERKNVVYAHDVLAGKVDVGEKVVIVGGGGVGCETALYLTDEGSIDAETMVFLLERRALSPERALKLLRKSRDVVIVEMMERIGRDIGLTTRWTIRQSLELRGVRIVTNARVDEITDEGVIVNNGEQFFEADTVVIAVGAEPNNELIKQLEGKVAEVYAVGDCINPRKALEAIREATEIATKI
ncbi:MAG: FAD-dependent oxidoreductase [Candidatus Jordarchaeales archaeon]